MPFQRSTITLEEVPKPRTKRPGAADAIDAALWASSAGPLVNAGRIAVPSRSSGAQMEARASGASPSWPSASAVQASV